MVGSTLGEIRRHIESLATPSGSYYLACARTGERPIPAAGCRFENRSDARAAAKATEQYRAALRRYDPQVPYYDLIVREERTAASGDGQLAQPVVTSEAPPADRDGARPSRTVVDFCHTVAAAVFEAIADSSYADLESAIMESYLSAAESIEDPDELCLSLLERLSAELDARLDPKQQAALLRTVSTQLPPVTGNESKEGDPLESTLAELQSVGLLASYALDRRTGGPVRTWRVTIEDYLPSLSTDQVNTLPIVVELFRRLSTESVTIRGVERAKHPACAAWRFEVATATAEPVGIVRAPVSGGR